jgi:hypothetical protein
MPFTNDLKREFEILGLSALHTEVIARHEAYWDTLPEVNRLYLESQGTNRKRFVLEELWADNTCDIRASHPPLWTGEKAVLFNLQLMTAKRTASLRAKKLVLTPLGGEQVEKEVTLSKSLYDFITVVPDARITSIAMLVHGYCRAHLTRSELPLLFGDLVTLHAEVRQFCG